jgi:hypothetical protein
VSCTNNPGRFVGLLYLFMSIPGFFAMIYVPSNLIVEGNVTATSPACTYRNITKRSRPSQGSLSPGRLHSFCGFDQGANPKPLASFAFFGPFLVKRS